MNPRIKALASFLGCSTHEVNEAFLGFRDEVNFSAGAEEYMVLTDEEATNLAQENLANSLWAINPETLLHFMQLPSEAKEMLTFFQREKCEAANETFKAMLGARMLNLIEHCIQVDGRVHYLNTYDGKEHMERTKDGVWYIYRIS